LYTVSFQQNTYDHRGTMSQNVLSTKPTSVV